MLDPEFENKKPLSSEERLNLEFKNKNTVRSV
jgi:hypothetical protein